MGKPPATRSRAVRLPNELWQALEADADTFGTNVNRVVIHRLNAWYRHRVEPEPDTMQGVNR